MSKLNVCILFGGISPEHDVSLRSAESVLNNLDHNKYNVFPLGITNGTHITIIADGADEVEAIDALAHLIGGTIEE